MIHIMLLVSFALIMLLLVSIYAGFCAENVWVK